MDPEINCFFIHFLSKPLKVFNDLQGFLSRYCSKTICSKNFTSTDSGTILSHSFCLNKNWDKKNGTTRAVFCRFYKVLLEKPKNRNVVWILPGSISTKCPAMFRNVRSFRCMVHISTDLNRVDFFVHQPVPNPLVYFHLTASRLG